MIALLLSRARRVVVGVALSLVLLPSAARADLTIVSGDCGELDTELLDASSHLFTTTVEVFECDFVEAGMTEGGLEIFTDGNAGGSSIYSEILAHDLAAACDGATLLKTETEILYDDPNGKKTDLLVEIDGTRIGVSVTRAITFPPGTPLTLARAEEILFDKLDDVLASSANVSAADAWQKQILVVEVPVGSDRDQVVAAYGNADSVRRADTIVWAVDTDGSDEFLYFGDAPTCESTATPAAPAPLVVRAFPNPFNPTTTFAFELERPASVSLRVLDARGRVVRTLAAGRGLAAGEHRLRWRGRDDRGVAVGSGIYLLRLTAGERSGWRRVVLAE